ncbi:MAG: polysaccharide pyruvyl transferase family protein [Prevotellaceae bacterium]|nr:polysaccharide pyruvyl transferase family protein [Prevotellaceae bacterium]
MTDSFHGCVFSIIFRKPFVAIANTERGSDRFSTLLNDLALTNRLIFSFNEFVKNESDLFSPIDYDCVYRKYDMQKEQSLQWLREKLM